MQGLEQHAGGPLDRCRVRDQVELIRTLGEPCPIECGQVRVRQDEDAILITGEIEGCSAAGYRSLAATLGALLRCGTLLLRCVPEKPARVSVNRRATPIGG
jgi:hypothetical protein